jgi:hypothetical protein
MMIYPHYNTYWVTGCVRKLFWRRRRGMPGWGSFSCLMTGIVQLRGPNGITDTMACEYVLYGGAP